MRGSCHACRHTRTGLQGLADRRREISFPSAARGAGSSAPRRRRGVDRRPQRRRHRKCSGGYALCRHRRRHGAGNDRRLRGPSSASSPHYRAQAFAARPTPTWRANGSPTVTEPSPSSLVSRSRGFARPSTGKTGTTPSAPSPTQKDRRHERPRTERRRRQSLVAPPRLRPPQIRTQTPTPSIPIRTPGREDLAAGLARTPRWGGSSKWQHSLSVAQHSLTVLALRELDGPLMFWGSFRDRPIQQRGASTSKSATNAGTSNWL